MAASVVEEGGFWLPSEFLDDFVTDKENNMTSADLDSDYCFPNEFPYDFQVESGQHLKEKLSVMSTSPQSTLAHLWSFSGRSGGGSSNNSPNGVTSPPATPFGARNDAVGDLIHRAAGQVAMLKLSGGDGPGPTRHAGLLGPPRRLEQMHTMTNTHHSSAFHNIYEQMLKHQKQSREMWYTEPQMLYGRVVGVTGQDGWPIQQNPNRVGRSGPRPVLFAGSGGPVKRECAGTGVFLPRRYATNNNNNDNSCNAYSSESRKRPGYPSAYIPDTNAHALNKSFDKINDFVQSQPLFQPKFNKGFVPEYDLLMARRNALMLQHRRSLLVEGSSLTSRGISLPQEWTY